MTPLVKMHTLGHSLMPAPIRAGGLRYPGHGYFDLGADERYMLGELEDYEYPAEKVREALADLPEVAV